ncbi:MAG TPA: ABC transporter ATP-binding protein [Geobacteraceae bacterium]|nr:ABC transporter ATP-binding protein [Geobacteraceae bacterium]
MLALSDVHLSYGHVRAVKGVTIRVQAGEIVTLIGANGAGKSSILKAISGVQRIGAGAITLDGVPLHTLPPHRIVAAGVSHCPEGRRVFYDLTVRENLLMGGYLLEKKELAERLEWAVGLFPRLGERIDQSGGTLSGGEQQMLAIARALMCKPRLLMLDEPSLGLAPLMVERIFETIVELNRGGLTVLLVEQNAHVALEISRHAYVLETGRVSLEGGSRALLADERVRKAYLGG